MSRTYHFDGLGSTIALTDENGNITDEYSYDAWGNLTSHTGPGALTIDNPYQFVGELGYYTHYQETDLGLLQLGVRYYHPGIGRFISLDAARDDVNWYAYAENNPINAADPAGLWVETALDVAGLGYDIYEFKKRPSILGGLSIAADVAGIALPLVPSVGGAKLGYKAATKLAAHADDAGKAAKTATFMIGKTSKELSEQIAKGLLKGERKCISGGLKRIAKPAKGMVDPQAHHIFPVKFGKWFEAKGIDFNDPIFATWVEQSTHSKMSYAYNKEWEKWIVKNPNAGVNQIKAFAKQLAAKKEYQFLVHF